MHNVIVRLAINVSLISAASAAVQCPAFAYGPPEEALRVGYAVNTFSATFTTETVDMADVGKSGFAWYSWHFFGYHLDINEVTLNRDGSVTLEGNPDSANAELATATVAKTAAGFVGTAFGGGAYIEAVLKFNPVSVVAAQMKGWPSFWSMAVEHLVQNNEQWQGKPQGYAHFIEPDFFEFDVEPSAACCYGATMHDWYGVYQVTCPGSAFCDTHPPYSQVKKQVPQHTDFSQYHRYGFLWIPATNTRSGSVKFYFDGEQIGVETRWTQFTNQLSTPIGQSWQYGILDRQHLVLILGTGAREPMTVQSVTVWQASANENIRF